MRIKYSPCEGRDAESVIVTDRDVLTIAGVEYIFDTKSLQWPDIAKHTNGAITEAHRDKAGELYVTVRQFYHNGESLSWDTGEYDAFSR